MEETSRHFPQAAENTIVIIPKTGHTYQGKERVTAETLRDVVLQWEAEREEVDAKEVAACRS